MEGRDAAERLAALEDRLVADVCPRFGRFRQITEARRRMVWAGQIVRLARQDTDDAKLKTASAHLRKAIRLVEEAGHEL